MRPIIIYFILLSLASADICLGSIVFVNVLFRHGNRTIASTYPNDPYKDPKYWPEGFGQLTQSGIAAQHELGEWLRSRYPDLLPSDKFADFIQVRSTNKNRTIMSAKACLDGFLGSSEGIRIEIEPGTGEIFYEAEPCPKFKNLRTEFERTNPWYLKIINENKELIKNLSNYTGMDIVELKDISDVYSTLLVETLFGYKLPDWTNIMYPEPLRTLTGQSFYVDANTDEMARLIIGPFVRELLKNFKDKVEMKSKKKVALYSGHDITIADLLNGMRVFNGIPPPYSGAVLIELHQVNAQHYVQVLYRNTTLQAPFELTVPGCQMLCPLSTFQKILQSIVPIDINTECQLNQPTLAYQTSGVANDQQFFANTFVVVFCYVFKWLAGRICSND